MNSNDGTRRSFLGHLGLTAAAGLGLALLPSAAQAEGTRGSRSEPAGRSGAQAVAYRCCVSTCRNCGSGQVAYYCTRVAGGCPPSYCTPCGTSRGTCYDQIGC